MIGPLLLMQRLVPVMARGEGGTIVMPRARPAKAPVWTPMPDGVKRQLARRRRTSRAACTRFAPTSAKLILPYGTGNTHPRFWGWVHGTGTAGGMLAEMAAAAMNANCGGRDHGAIHVEKCVVDWMAQWFGLPTATAGGLLVTGSSMANLLGLAAARNRAVKNVRRDGVNGARLTGYVSREGAFLHRQSLRIARAWPRRLAPHPRRSEISRSISTGCARR